MFFLTRVGIPIIQPDHVVGVQNLQAEILQKAELPAPLRTLVVSADTETRLQEALTLGAHGVIRKPFTNDELVEAVEQMYLN